MEEIILFKYVDKLRLRGTSHLHLIRQKQKQKRRLTFEELKKREFLNRVCLLLHTVWPELHIVCVLLEAQSHM